MAIQTRATQCVVAIVDVVVVVLWSPCVLRNNQYHLFFAASVVCPTCHYLPDTSSLAWQPLRDQHRRHESATRDASGVKQRDPVFGRV